MVLQRSMHDLRGSICHRYIALFYIYKSAMKCAKFGVAVLQASMLSWGVSLPWVYVHCAIYETFLV